MVMPRIPLGHAENFRKCIDAKLGFCACFPYTSMAILNRENTYKILMVMLDGTILNDDFQRNTALQHCYYMVSNGCNIVPTFDACTCVALKIVVANRPMKHHLKLTSMHFLKFSAWPRGIHGIPTSHTIGCENNSIITLSNNNPKSSTQIDNSRNTITYHNALRLSPQNFA